MLTNGTLDGLTVARAHGVYNVLSGVWPVVHMPSFEFVFGPKADRWLARAVGSLLIANGIVQLRTKDSADSVEQARRIGVGTAATLATFDLIYVPAGVISKTYLIDVVAEVTWLTIWSRTRK